MSIQTAIQNAQQKVANAYTAVSEKGGTLPATQNLSNLPAAIGSISTGSGTTINNQDKTVTTNGTYTADSGYTGLGTVTVNVPTTTPSGTLSITQNGTYDVTNYANANVNVAGGGSGGDSSSSDWQPDPDWWDIKSILEADTRNYTGKAIILYSNSDNFTDITISSPCVAVATSDGAFYTATATHTWDRSKDKIVSSDINDATPKYGTRYLILYFNTADVVYTALTNFRTGSIYALFGCNLTKSSTQAVSNNTFFYLNSSLQSFEFLAGYNLNFGTNFSSFCRDCHSLTKLPDNLDTSNGTNFSYFCCDCHSLTKLPDNLDTSNGTNFSSFCRDCHSLTKLPDNLDTSNGTNFSGFCRSCSSLTKLPDNLDTSNGTNFSSFCRDCHSLTKLPDNLDTSNGTNFSSFCGNCYSLTKTNIKLANQSVTTLSNSTLIDIESLEYIANNAPTVTGTVTLTIGSTNITRAGGASGSIITTLTNKGWTVN